MCYKISNKGIIDMRQLTLIDNDIKDLDFEVEEGEELKLDFAAFSNFPIA